MSAGVVALAVLVAYLLGSISWSYLIVRVLRGVDIRTVGSRNPGATNVLRVAGPVPAAAALLLDAGKGAAAVVFARWLEASTPVVAAVGVAAVLGHLYPVFFGFRGGKGVATAAGTLAMLAPWAVLCCLALFVVLVAWTRYVSVGSVATAVACPLFVLVFGLVGWNADPRWPWLFAGVLVIGLLIVFKHRENLGRLAAGTEKKLGHREDAQSLGPAENAGLNDGTGGSGAGAASS
ncbi:MAG TPA: glycerol-3-phosphate 1-O-acyltransferase PlsY [Thermoanaerobaculia bacterium]|nr:glycerol-3-phosphate 1-O-acyltransferase PlsY [Thermoanaerobaculia bacterium]